MKFEDKTVVTHQQLILLGNTTGEIIDVCFLKVTPNAREDVTRFLWNLFLSYKVREIFTSKHLSMLAAQLYEHTAVNDFVQEVTTSLGINAATICSENSSSLEKTIAVGLVGEIHLTGENLVSFTPKTILDNTESNPEVIYRLLVSNRWLTTLVMIIMNFQNSKLWLETSQLVYAKNKEDKPAQ